MRKFRTGMSKLVLAGLVIFGFSVNLQAGYTFISNIGTSECTLEGITDSACKEDMECTIRKEFCTTVGNTLGGTVEVETIKGIVTWGGKGLVKIIQLAIDNKIIKPNKSSYSYIITEVGKTLGIVGGVGKVGSIKKMKGTALVTFTIETIFEIAVDYLIDKSDLEFARFNNAPIETYRKAFKLLFRVLKNDLKAGYYLTIPTLSSKVDAFQSGVFDNLLVTGEIGIEVYNSSVEYISAAEAAEYSRINLQIINLYIEAKEKYLKKNITNIPITFFNDCENISLDATTKNHCKSYFNDLIKARLYRHDLLMLRSKTFSFSQYEMFIKSYFPDDEYDNLVALYDIENLDSEILKTQNEVAYKYLKYALAYGFEIKDLTLGKTLFSETQTITENRALRLLNDGYLYLDTNNQTVLSTYTYSSVKLMTRRKFAILLNQVFNLEENFSQAKINTLKTKGAILNGSVGWFFEALILKKLAIAKGQGIGVSNQFRPDDNLTIYELLVMLINTMNYKKCGQVQCNVYTIMEIQ